MWGFDFTTFYKKNSKNTKEKFLLDWSRLNVAFFVYYSKDWIPLEFDEKNEKSVSYLVIFIYGILHIFDRGILKQLYITLFSS